MSFFQSIEFWIAKQIAEALLFIAGGIVVLLFLAVIAWLLDTEKK